MKSLSHLCSYVLRHKPESIGLTVDKNGWADVDELLAKINATDPRLGVTRAQLETMVKENDKQRFSFSTDGKRIRANQGHSIKVNLDLKTEPPPFELYHGTVPPALESIMRDGLKPMSRHAVHLSSDKSTAAKVGNRRGRAIILKVAARQMEADGHTFQKSENGVWLTQHVPPKYITVL